MADKICILKIWPSQSRGLVVTYFLEYIAMIGGLELIPQNTLVVGSL